ncbi:hypothetical protein ACHHYP_20607 [Achlya hypogyna]|uniref:DDE-1 domain-containing protein n=1 Tax=Achlya hypogyna TaxID=1202772 RepID=A0A1V9YHB6_ACHHY|nr:hypothetical protein ACHHYP_20607 [Achlya hypogyna]
MSADELMRQVRQNAQAFWEKTFWQRCQSHCQPFDVGVMGPYKAKLRAPWLRDTNKYSTPAAKRLAVIKQAIEAWDGITESCIKSAYAKAIPKLED